MALEVESRIASVTLYARGARVRRMTTIALAQDARVRIVGLPAAVIDDTVRVETEGGAVVTAVHVGLEAPPPAAAADEDTSEIRAARLRVALADAEIERVEAALAMLAAAPIALPGPGDEPPPAWAEIVEARRALVTLRAEREQQLRGQASAARREADEARRAYTAAIDRDRHAGGNRPAKLHELRKHVDLELDGTGPATVHLEYQVAAARWTPSYVARLDGEKVTFELRAAVAQDTGEDWAGVALRLSTAEPERFGALPELAAQRIGRRQVEPARGGFRAPPEGATALFSDYTRAFPDGEPTRRIGYGRVAGEPVPGAVADFGGASITGVWSGEPRAKRAVPPTPPPPQPMAPMPAMAPMQQSFGGPPMPMPPPSAAYGGGPPGMPPRGAPVVVVSVPDGGPPPTKSRSLLGGLAGSAAAAAPPLAPPLPQTPPPPPPRLDYANLRMAPPQSDDRGHLVPAARDRRAAALEAEVVMATSRVAALPLPRGCSTDWPHTYDYAYATDGTVDVPSDGSWHSIAVTAKPCTAKLRHVSVPREQQDVFRLATLSNPLGGPLLAGPIDVYDRGNFLVTSNIEQTPPAASVQIGLGVDPTVKLARNTEFREETTGVLRGGLRLHHAIKVDVDNLSDRTIDLEVRERLPVTREDDDDIEVIVGRIEPGWERFTPDAGGPREQRLRGGYRWRISMPAGTKRTLRAAYEVRIAGKHELVGGNRRES